MLRAGHRAIVPYLRGYGATRFLSAETMRSGQQAAIGQDLLDLMDALNLPRAVLVGFDWGGRAACVVAALWPERVRGLVIANGYSIQNIAASKAPVQPGAGAALLVPVLFPHRTRTRRADRRTAANCASCLWRLWSPNWKFDDATYERTAKSFDNPDFVDIVIHSYRHRFGYAPGDPAFEALERRLAAQPPIAGADHRAPRRRRRGECSGGRQRRSSGSSPGAMSGG